MIITITGNAASGKSTAGKALSKKLKLKHYSTGNYMREMAEKRGITLGELGGLAEKDSSIDKEIDQWCANLGKTEDNFILDTRLGWHFIPKSIKIFLYVEPKEQARRLLLDKRVAEKFKDENDAMQQTVKRENSERKRYKKYYNLDYHDKKHYDFWLDTTGMDADGMNEELLGFIESL